ncbi:MAG: membrane protein of unknown function [Promethearchaeota archaeon]|nr:MAG: membrane protein of unknown function [Candidatus Lokiarchaeota archaeon]
MTAWYLYLIEIFIIAISVISLIASIENWRKSKININLFLIILLAIIVFSSVRQFIYLSGLVGDITFGESLSILGIVSIIIIIIPIQFLIYLKNWRRFYSFPIIFGFYVALALYISPNDLFYRIIIMIVGGIFFFSLFIDGIKAKNGLSLSISIIFIYGLSYFPGVADILSGIFRLTSAIAIALGVFGFFEKYILVDKEEEEKVKRTWIARMAGDED